MSCSKPSSPRNEESVEGSNFFKLFFPELRRLVAMPRPPQYRPRSVDGASQISQTIASSVTTAIVGVLPSILKNSCSVALMGATDRLPGAPDDMTLEFTVTCTVGSRARLGMRVHDHPSGKLVIGEIFPGGVMADWNVAFPRRAARAGDLILEVNGVSSDPASMALQLERIGDVKIKMHRVVEGDAPELQSWPPWPTVMEQLEPLAAAQHRIDAAAERQGKALEELAESHRRIEEKLMFLAVGQRYLAEQFHRNGEAIVASAGVGKSASTQQAEAVAKHAAAVEELQHSQHRVEEKLLFLAIGQRQLAAEFRGSKDANVAFHEEVGVEADTPCTGTFADSMSAEAAATDDAAHSATSVAPEEHNLVEDASPAAESSTEDAGADVDDFAALFPKVFPEAGSASHVARQLPALGPLADGAQRTVAPASRSRPLQNLFAAGGLSCGKGCRSLDAYSCNDIDNRCPGQPLPDEVTPDVDRHAAWWTKQDASADGASQLPDIFGSAARGRVSDEAAATLFGGRKLQGSARNTHRPEDAAEVSARSAAADPGEESSAPPDDAPAIARDCENTDKGDAVDCANSMAAVPTTPPHPRAVERHGRKNPRFNDTFGARGHQGEDEAGDAAAAEGQLAACEGVQDEPREGEGSQEAPAEGNGVQGPLALMRKALPAPGEATSCGTVRKALPETQPSLADGLPEEGPILVDCLHAGPASAKFVLGDAPPGDATPDPEHAPGIVNTAKADAWPAADDAPAKATASPAVSAGDAAAAGINSLFVREDADPAPRVTTL